MVDDGYKENDIVDKYIDNIVSDIINDVIENIPKLTSIELADKNKGGIVEKVKDDDDESSNSGDGSKKDLDGTKKDTFISQQKTEVENTVVSDIAIDNNKNNNGGIISKEGPFQEMNHEMDFKRSGNEDGMANKYAFRPLHQLKSDNDTKDGMFEDVTNELDTRLGFRTDEPLDWFKAFQQYIWANNLVNTVELDKDDKGTFTVCKIQIVYGELREILVSIDFSLGIVFIEGASCSDWMQKEFDVIKSFIVCDKSVQKEVENGDRFISSASGDEEGLFVPIVNDAIEKNIESLSKKTTLLEQTLQRLEASLVDLTTRINNTIDYEGEKKRLEDRVMEIEKGLDNKIMLFMAEIEYEVKNSLTNLSRKMEEQIYSQQTAIIDQFKVLLEKELIEMINDKNEASGCDESESDSFNDVEEGKSGQKTINSWNPTTTKRINRVNRAMFQESEKSAEVQHVRGPKNTVTGKRSPVIDRSTEIVMCFDSNGRSISYRKLWTLNGTQYKKCKNFHDLNRVIETNVEYKNLKYFFFNVGGNDLDHHSPVEVFKRFVRAIRKLKIRYPDLKIIISELLPRMDGKDYHVRETNSLLNDYVITVSNLYVVRNKNLRYRDFFVDAKHLRLNGIPRFAANIKRALHRAYGIVPYDDKIHADTSNNADSSAYQNRNEFTEGQIKICQSRYENDMKKMKQNLLRKLMTALTSEMSQ